MNRYLTEKASGRRLWRVPVAALSLVLVIISIEVWIEDRNVGDLVIYLLAHLIVTGLMAWPLAHVIRDALRCRRARDIAGRLARRREAALPLDGLDRTLGVKDAAKKIRDLTGKGYLKLVSVDENAQCLWLDNPEPEVTEPCAPASEKREFDEIIAKIRGLNDDIADAAVSEKIDRLEAVTASIFRAIEERPDRAETARRFMNYYLPTTLRLLESYRLMEDQSFQGENIQYARRRIEAVLDKLVSATERQQDKLFSMDALDVEAEIRVLETMMESDGLTRSAGMK